MQHAAHVARYHQHMFFRDEVATHSDAYYHHQLSYAKYLFDMNLANNFRDVKGYKRCPLKKLDELEGELESWASAAHALVPPVVDAYQRDTDKRWVIVADFGYAGYSSEHHHLAMALSYRGICVYRHGSK